MAARIRGAGAPRPRAPSERRTERDEVGPARRTSIGGKVREGWPEVADVNDNVMRVDLAGGALAYKDQKLTLYRSGAPEQVWLVEQP